MRYLRLKKQKEFSVVLRSGKRVYQGSVTMMILPAKQLKFAVCVGKRYGKSVARNRIKRLLREAFRPFYEKIISPCFILLIPRVASEYTLNAFSRDMKKILEREKLIEDTSFIHSQTK